MQVTHMNKSVVVYSLILVFGVFISSVSQVILKKSSAVKKESFIKEYLNAPVIVAYSLFFAATLLSIIAYKVIPMMLGVVLDSTSYIFVTVFGLIFFKEKLNLKKAAALMLIISGIIVFSLQL